MSLVTYNGIVFPYSHLTRFETESVYEDSKTDMYLSRFDIACQAVINFNYLPILAPGLINNGTATTTNPADIFNYLYENLMKPRQALSIKVNGVEMIPTTSWRIDHVDAANGPQPQRCAITMLTSNAFILTWECVAHYWVHYASGANGVTLPATTQAGDPFLMNRWEETQQIDQCNISTFTRSGTCVLRTDNQESTTIDELRTTMAVVGVRPGFIRKSRQYQLDKSGTKLNYTVTDVEQFKMPPSPAFEASGDYTETIPRMAPYVNISCRIKLKGAKDTPQHTLVETAVAVVSSKINLQGAPTINGQKNRIATLEGAHLRVDMYKNEVDFEASAMLFRANKHPLLTIAGLSVLSTVTPYPGGNAQAAQANFKDKYSDYGTANILLLAAAYYDPSLPGHAIAQAQDSIMNIGRVPGQDAS